MFLKESYCWYADDTFEVFITDKYSVVHDVNSGKFYEAQSSHLPEQVTKTAQRKISIFSTKAALFATFSTLIMLAINITLGTQEEEVTTSRFLVWFVPYMVISVVLHEGAHIGMLRVCGKRIDKIGFKLNYIIFPAFYVRMNQTVLLPMADRIMVHVAGIWMNLTLNCCVYILNRLIINSNDLSYSLKFATIALAANALPILNSDGYRCLLAWANVNEYLDGRRNPRWVSVIKAIGWIVVVIYVTRFVFSVIA